MQSGPAKLLSTDSTDYPHALEDDLLIEVPAFIKDIMQRIEQNGYKVFIKGGYVRDRAFEMYHQYLSLDSSDIDLVTNCPEELLRVIFGHGFTAQPYIEHSFCYAHPQQPYPVDITFKLVLNLEELAKSVDFNINALFANQQGQVFDPLGQGIMDIQSVQCRTVINAIQSMREDPSRIHRAMALVANLGINLDAELFQAMKRYAPRTMDLPLAVMLKGMERCFLRGWGVAGFDFFQENVFLPLFFNFQEESLYAYILSQTMLLDFWRDKLLDFDSLAFEQRPMSVYLAVLFLMAPIVYRLNQYAMTTSPAEYIADILEDYFTDAEHPGATRALQHALNQHVPALLVEYHQFIQEQNPHYWAQQNDIQDNTPAVLHHFNRESQAFNPPQSTHAPVEPMPRRLRKQ